MSLRVFSWKDVNEGVLFDCLPSLCEKGCALSVGSFDGPHLGHTVLIQRLLAQTAFIPGVVTFVFPPRFSGLGKHTGTVISTVNQRLAWFEKAGVAFAVVIDFSPEFSTIKGADFLSVLFRMCNMRFVVEGSDFRFGYHGSCGITDIKRFAIEKDIGFEIPKEVLFDKERISSSRIRAAIATGNFSLVKVLLGRNFEIDCRQTVWTRDGGSITAAFDQILPKDGRYTVLVHLRDGTVFNSAAETANGILRLPNCNCSQYIGTIQFVP